MKLGNGLIHKSNITLLKQSFMDYVRHGQGRKWLPKTGWASSNVEHRCPCATTRRRLLFCQKLGGQLLTLPNRQLRP